MPSGGAQKTDPHPAGPWPALCAGAREYLAAGAWQSAHDLLWPALAPHWSAGEMPADAFEGLCLLLSACARLRHQDHLQRGLPWVRSALAAGAIQDPEALALATLTLAQEETRTGDYAGAEDRLAAWEREAPEQVRPATRARVALLQARIAAVRGAETHAEHQALAALGHADQAGSDLLKGDAYALLAILKRRQGRLAEAQRLYARAARHYWQAGDLAGHTTVVLNRGWVAGLIGLLSHAAALFEEAEAQAEALQRPATALLARLGLGWIAVRGGVLEEGRARLLAAWRAARRMSLAREEGLACEYLAEGYLLAGEQRKAARAIRCGQRIAARLAPDGDLAIELELRQATLALAEGHPRDAVAAALRARRQAQRASARWEAAQAWRLLGTALARAGRRQGAVRAFRRAYAGLGEMGELLERRLVAAWLRALAASPPAGAGGRLLPDLGLEQGSEARALRFWREHPLLGPDQAGLKTSTGQRDQVERGGRRVPSASESAGAARSTLHPIWSSIGFVSQSPAVHEVLHLVETYAPSALPALILGESGTGKDLIAQGIHALSGQPGRYVPVNCAAVRKDLFAAELFGARRGAYTGATEHRAGLAVAAEGGTLFFDEVADLELEAQGFLLRFLDSGEVRPLGATQSRRVETRIVAATCADLPALVAAGRFRPDLYGRLAGLVVRLPSLRERPEDLVPILHALWAREGGAPQDCTAVFDRRLLAALRAWRWPGNVRELRHAVQRGMLYARTHGPAAAQEALITWMATLPAAESAAEVSPPSPASAESARRRRGDWAAAELTAALERAGGRVAEAAKILGLSRSHAYRLYRRLDAEASGEREEPGSSAQRRA